jgi:hypothetical protein
MLSWSSNILKVTPKTIKHPIHKLQIRIIFNEVLFVTNIAIVVAEAMIKSSPTDAKNILSIVLRWTI